MSYIFEIRDNEEEKCTKWQKEHKKVCTLTDVGAIGGGYTFSFTQTGIGCIKIITCACGEKLDLTDWKGW